MSQCRLRHSGLDVTRNIIWQSRVYPGITGKFREHAGKVLIFSHLQRYREGLEGPFPNILAQEQMAGGGFGT